MKIRKIFSASSIFLNDTYVLKFENLTLHSNKVVCFFHGFPAMNQKNYDIAEHLCLMGYTTYIMHYDGLGLSKGNFSFQKCFFTVDNLLNYIKENEESKSISLLGHSWGGFIALSRYHLLKERNKLILLAPFCKLPSDAELPSFINNLKDECREILNTYSVDLIISELKEIQNANSFNNICNEINGSNVLILHGENDLEIKPEDTNELVKKFKLPPHYYLLDEDHIFSKKRLAVITIIKEWLTTYDNIL